jgi:hypothetical protein
VVVAIQVAVYGCVVRTFKLKQLLEQEVNVVMLLFHLVQDLLDSLELLLCEQHAT